VRNDPGMPNFIARFVCGIIEDIVPDIKEEVVYSVVGKVHGGLTGNDRGAVPVESLASRSCGARFCGCLRGLLLYHWQPYDQQSCSKCADVWYWVLLLIAICPFYGAQQIFHLLLFLLIDRSDEFQLCKYILDFKGLQALTLGVFGCIYGASRYAYCVNNKPLSCDIDGPGAYPAFYYELILFGAHLVLCWFAFMLLPCSEKKGEVTHTGARARAAAGTDEPECGGCCGHLFNCHGGRGGRLRRWLFFDTLIFVLAGALVGALVAMYPHLLTAEGNGQLRQLLFWAKVAYGLLSAPYMLFLLPLVSQLATHARPTGYDKHGRLRPMQKMQRSGGVEEP
jgi:hypothetical protein